MRHQIKLMFSGFLMITILFSACKKNEDSPTPDPPEPLTWSQIPAIPNVFREQPSSFSIGNKAYFGLGLGNTDGRYRVNVSENNDFWEFDITTNIWRRLADFPGGKRTGATSFAVNGRGYIAFGTSYNDIWEYNPLTDTWSKLSNISSPDASRNMYRTFVISNKHYFMFGSNCYEFDPKTYSFIKRASCPIVPFSGVFSLNNKGYVLLGDSDFIPPFNKSVYEYDPVTDAWTRKKDFPGQPRINAVSFGVKGFGYCGVGYRRGSPNQYLKDLWRYNPATDEWTQIEDYPGIGSVDVQAIVMGDKVILGSGYGYATNQFLYDNNFWLFQPK